MAVSSAASVNHTNTNVTVSDYGIQSPIYSNIKAAGTPTLTKGLTLAQIKNGLSRTQKFFNNKGRLPKYVSYGSKKIPISQFLKILASKGLKINRTPKHVATKSSNVIHGYWINKWTKCIKKNQDRVT